MKHILSLLTITLAFAAVTASAANYYDYYENVTVSDPVTTMINPEPGNPWWTAPIQSDIVSYDNYQIIRTTAPNGSIGSTVRYKVRITGESVKVYLTDFIDNVGGDNNSNAIANKGIAQYGYHYLDSNDPDKVDTTVTKDLVAEADPIDSHYFEQNEWYKYTVTRNQYFLGTFSAGDEFEIFMTDNNGNTAYSYSSLYKGGYGEGIDVVEHTDQLMLYYKDGVTAAANKAMPLAALDPTSRVYFGIYGEASGPVGSPLPGGLPIALVAGFFAFGFWYVRRRKAIAV